MASLALGIVGGAFLGPIGAAVGSAIGSYIDNAFIMPSLFPPEDVQGPRLDDLALTAATEGTPLNFGMGPECRVGATVLWTSDLIEEKIKHSQGKGGGGGGDVVEYRYYVDVAMGYNFGREISKVIRMWANGTVMYDEDPDVVITDDVISHSYVNTVGYKFDPDTGWAWEILDTYGKFKIEAAGAGDFTDFRSGKNIVVSGFTGGAAVLNGTYQVLSTWENPSTGDTTVRVKGGVQYTASAGDTVTISQNLPKFVAGDINTLTFYNGSLTQLVNSTIEAYEGTGTVPAFRNHAYAFFGRLALKNYGNRPPQISVLYEADASPFTVADAIELILENSGFTSAEYDTSGVTGNLRGYVIRGPMSGLKQLQPLMLAYNVLAQEDNGVLKFFMRENAETIEIDPDDLAAHEGGGDAPRVVRINDTVGFDLPSEVDISYVDPGKAYQTGSQRERRLDTPTDHKTQIQLPLVMEPVDARKIAKRILWTPWANRQKFALRLPPKYMHIQENDLIEFTAYDNDFIALVSRVDRGLNGIIEIEAMAEVASTLNFDAEAEEASFQAQKMYVPPETELFILDLGPLREEDIQTPGIYLAPSAADINAHWNGGVLNKSTNPTQYFNWIADVYPEATMGRASTTLGGGVTGRVWDRENTVTVELINGELESITEEEVLNGQNWAMIGNEIIAFADATLISSGTYELSTLLRGLRDTEYAIDDHSSSGEEEFVFLNDSAILFHTHPQGHIGTTKYYKCIPDGGDKDDYDSVDHYHQGGTIRPFSPCQIRAELDGSNNIDVEWVRRYRGFSRLFGVGAVPLGEVTESYEIDVYSGATVVNTYTVADATTWEYTSAAQTADGFSPPLSSIKLEIFQMSDRVGRSRGRLETITL